MCRFEVVGIVLDRPCLCVAPLFRAIESNFLEEVACYEYRWLASLNLNERRILLDISIIKCCCC